MSFEPSDVLKSGSPASDLSQKLARKPQEHSKFLNERSDTFWFGNINVRVWCGQAAVVRKYNADLVL